MQGGLGLAVDKPLTKLLYQSVTFV